MRQSRAVVLVWVLVVVILVALELAELTHFYTFPIAQALADPISLVFGLVFTTVVAVIGAIFVGIYISSRLLSTRGFTPFEEEMLRMRADLKELRTAVEGLRGPNVAAAPPPPGRDPRPPEPR